MTQRDLRAMSIAVARAVARWLYEQRFLIVFFFAALYVRWHWNTEVHPPGDYIYSDMRGYIRRAEGMMRLLADPDKTIWMQVEYDAFYPYGTHVFLFGLEWTFGTEAYEKMAKAYAVVGALLVAVTYLLARRVSKFTFVPPIVGAIAIFYYPHISLGGYFLSEVPFALCFVTSAWMLARLVDSGRWYDALGAGVAAALGFTLRPQILLSIAFFGLLWIVWRKRMPKVRISGLAIAFVPLLAMIAFSSWRLHHHTGRVGLISENGKFNQVFGRCHNNKIVAHPDSPKRRRTSFGPPPLIQLEKRQKKMPKAWPGLDPAGEVKFEYKGYIGDADKLQELIDECVRKTGVNKQVEYSLVNVLLLWRYNVMWPDSAKPPFKEVATQWGVLHASTLTYGALLAMLAVFLARYHVQLAVLSVHVWAIIIIAIAYLGGVRFRSPYDMFILLAALETYAVMGLLAWRLARRVASGPRERSAKSVPRDET